MFRDFKLSVNKVRGLEMLIMPNETGVGSSSPCFMVGVLFG